MRSLLGVLGVALLGCSSPAAVMADAGTRARADAVARADATHAQDARARDAPAQDAPAPDAAVAGCDATPIAGQLLPLVGDLVSAMRARGGAGSNALVLPAAADRDRFAATVVRALRGDARAACELPAPYRYVRLSEPDLGEVLLVAELDAGGRPAPALFYGSYAARAGATGRALAVEAPHPIFDSNTESQSAEVFVKAHASWLLLAGTHRCADAAAAPCSGTTSACGTTAPYRISDPAHSVATPFFAVHAALSSSDAALTFLQLHGNAAACPTALLSDSSGDWSDAGPTGRLAASLAGAGVAVGKCGAGFPTAACNLCGTDNVEARLTAGASDACTMTGAAYGRVIHLEQQADLRTSYQPLIAAVVATFPER